MWYLLSPSFATILLNREEKRGVKRRRGKIARGILEKLEFAINIKEEKEIANAISSSITQLPTISIIVAVTKYTSLKK